MSGIRPPLWAGIEASGLLAALANPPDRYRPVPWLAWTGELHWPGLREQLADMRDKGITEFFLFPIYGMEIPYMSAAYWQRVGQTLEFCSDHGMKCWVYDEYNWPSGVCAGTVLRDHPDANAQVLWVRPDPASPDAQLPPGVDKVHAAAPGAWGIGPYTGSHISSRGCDWVSAVAGYLDVLSPSACRRFLESTHERYLAHAGGAFPDSMPGFFTDEPGFHTHARDGWTGLPFTRGLFDAFRGRYGYDLRDRLPDLVADGPEAARTRCHYWRLVAERFGEAYGGQIRAWCDAHGLALTGHGLGEEMLVQHVGMSGDLWEILRHFTIPGIDLLANADGFTYPYGEGFYPSRDRRGFHLTCKFGHGVVRHSGGREMMSEAYGVCDWGLTPFRQKRGFHYQVALCVTLFNDNSLITSIADFRKYAIAGKHFTQPWWQHYSQYADYNARVAALHAEGEPVADVAVLFPRSTMWALADGKAFQGGWQAAPGGHPLNALQETLYDLLDELIRELWHFDMVFEPILETARIEGAELVTEHARYKAIVVPSAAWLPGACADVLRGFAEAGGIVVFEGDLPAVEPDTLGDLGDEVGATLSGDRAEHVEASGAGVCRVLERDLRRPLTLGGDGAREFVCSWRRLAGSDVLFVANMAECSVDVDVALGLEGDVVVCDPDTLEVFRPQIADGSFAWHFEPWQGYLVMVGGIAQATGDAMAVADAPAWLKPVDEQVLDGSWEFGLEPTNMLRLSLVVKPDPDNRGAAEGWQHDGAEDGWLVPDGRRLQEAIRPADAPWYWLRARVACEQGAKPRHVVVDNPDFLEVYVNGCPAVQVAGSPVWAEENVWFDVAGLLVEGENHIHVRARTSKYNDPRIAGIAATAHLLQPVMLLGEFLVGPDERLAGWTGSIRANATWEEQGMPHFAGVGVYRRTVRWEGQGRALLHLPACTDAVEVRVNGESCGVRAWPPYVFDVTEQFGNGNNDLEIRVHNTLGNVILETYGGKTTKLRPASGLTQCPRLLTI